MEKITVVINCFNEETELPGAISNAKKLTNEIVVIDMGSVDNSVKVARKLGARVYNHKKLNYVEPARNFGISKVGSGWILILDMDEGILDSLARELRQVVKKDLADYVRIPRKNIVFGKWMKHSRWWPDYNIRFFKKGHVSWGNGIHSIPITKGRGVDLEERDKFAIIHNNYTSVEDYLEKMNRYTNVQVKELIDKNYKFVWKDLIQKPLSEFLSRYFFGEGYKDGLHGLAVSILQSFSEVLLYLKIWQKEKFLEQAVTFGEVANEFGKVEGEVNWWITDTIIKNAGPVKSLPLRVKRRLKGALKKRNERKKKT